MRLLLISFTLLATILCGRILNGDLWVDYANAGSMTQLSFSFMLTNAINQWDYIKVALPFPLHSSLVPAYPATEGLSLPLQLTVTYQYVDGSSNIQPTIYTCQALTQTIDSSNYYIRFYNTDRKTMIPIPANQWFYLKFQITGTSPLQYQKSSSILQIQISTVSSVWTNSMVYDDNLAFNYFQLAPAPTKGITLSATPYAFGSAGGYLLTQATYSMYLDVTTNIDSYQFQQNLKLVFLINQTSSYNWVGPCSSVAKTNAPTIPQLNASLYTCTVDSINNIMTVLLTPAAFATQTSYRFTVLVQNPPVVINNVDIIVRAVKQVSGVILSYGSATAALNTNQIYITYQQIFVGWGLRPDALLPFDAPIFRGNAATPTYMPYNSLSTRFQISQSTASSTQLRIQINIPSQSSAFVLETGYTHNLPSFNNKQARCVVQYATDTIKRKIACTGIGALNSTTVYYIGWKMFFPYDNYQSAVDCTKFGLITVYSALTITAQDNLFILGRGDPFLAYLKSSPNYYVIGRNSSYISYMKTFANLNMMVLSSDFQQFLQTPQQVIVTNRPDTYLNKIYNDVYVIGQNLAFMTYLQLFPDIYIAYQLKSNSDITKGYLSTPLIATSMPKNTLSIKTYNSQDWTGYSTNLNSVFSTSTTSGTLTPTQGLKVQAGTNQALIFSMQALYSTVTSVSSSALTISNNWGMLIMLNPKIKLNAASVTLTQSAASLTATAVTINTNTSYNKYTLITLKGSTPSSLQTSFKTTVVKTVFSLFPFLISDFSSIFADQNNFDVMIATVDGIDGPLNRMTFNGYFLFNGFTMMNSAAINTINSGYVGYSHAAQMDGSIVPTMIRAKGTIAGTTNFYAFCVFFDNLAPFFSNYHNGDIYCQTTDPSNKCKYRKGAQTKMTSYDYLNYHTYSRFQIKLANPANPFDIMIPVKATQGKVQTYFYLGYITKDPITGAMGFAYMSPRKVIVHSGTATANSGTYGPVLTGSSLGQVLSLMTLKAVSSGVTQNSGDNLGGAFLYFSEWDYFGTPVPTGWSNGPCYILKYLLYSTNYAAYLTGSSFVYQYKNMKGVICYTDTGNSIASAQLTVASSPIPTRWGLNLPGYGAYSQNTGNLLVYNTNYMAVPASLQITNTSTIITPTMGPNLVKTVGSWIIPLPVALQSSVKITMIGDSSANLPFTTTGGTCGIYISGVKTTVGCVCTTSPTQVDYILTIIEPDLLPALANMQLVHYGLSTNSSYNNSYFSFKVYSLLTTNNPSINHVIFYANNVLFPYGNGSDLTYVGPSQIRLSSYTQRTNNKAAITSFNFSFSVLGKGLYVTNRVRINLGQYHIENSASQINPTCSIYTYTVTGSTQFSHDWAAVDATQGFNMLDFWPQKDLLNNNLTYTVRCNNFAAISTSSAVGISGRVVNTTADLTGQVSTTASIALATLPSMTQTNQITATKSFTIPSTYMQIQFTVNSPGITTDSILYIGFPTYYSNGLGPDIKCYSTNQIWCSVTDRLLMIRYMGTFTQGTTFVITVAGVQQPVNYNSGTFYFVIDNDDNPTVVLSSSTFVDSVSTSVLDTQNFPAFQILSMTQSSAYLRQQNVVLTLNFYVPSTLSSVTVGQYLFLVFPPNFANVLRFINPTCQLNIRGNTLKNYISSCTVSGMRLKMPFLDSLTLGSVYTLTVNGIINPTDPSSNTYKYALQITSSSGASIVARTYSPHANFRMPIFILNPIRISLDYYTAANGLVTQITTTANIQSQQVFISSNSTYLATSYARNVYLSPVNNLYSFPASLELLSGQNPYPIRFSALTSGVNFIYFQKSGDGSYYSSLPPLVLSINKNYFTPVSFLQTQFNLPVAPVNTNYTIGVNLPFNLYPMSQVNLTVTLSSAVGISLRYNPTVIQFYPQKISATISLYINDATLWTVGTTTNLTVTPSDTGTFAAPATIPITATAAVVSNPALTLALNTSSHKYATFQVTCSEQGRFIYHLSRQFNYNYTACSMDISSINYWIQQSSISALRVNQVYYECEDILGMVNIATPGTAQTITINNLKASTTYDIEGFCMSQIGTTSSLTKLSFQTLSNTGYVSKMDFVFTTQLSIAQKIKASCALALLFNVNYLKVSTSDGYYCSELLSSRLLQQQSPNIEISQKQSRIIKSRRILSTPTNRIQFYFGVNNDLTLDTSPTVIQTLSVNQTTITNQLANVVGLPSIVSMTSSAASYVGANDITSSSIFIDVGPTYAYIQGMTMPHNGIIYVIIGDDAIWPRAPVISQIKKGSGPNGLPPVYYKVLAYRTSQPYSSYAAFTSLGTSNYTIYVVGSDDNPFDSVNFGTIRTFSIYAQVPTWQNFLKLAFLLVLMLVLN